MLYTSPYQYNIITTGLIQIKSSFYCKMPLASQKTFQVSQKYDQNVLQHSRKKIENKEGDYG